MGSSDGLPSRTPSKGQERVDPEKPWRYACPDCGSVSVYTRYSDQRSHKETYPANGNGADMAKRDREKRFYCAICSERKVRVVDKKRGGKVTHP